MGAEFISSGKIIAGSARAAFNAAYANDEYNYGHDSYNGSFTTMDYCGVRKTFDGKFTANKLKQARKFIDKEVNNTDKRDAYVVDMGVVDYTITRVKAIKTKGKGRAVTKYVVLYGNNSGAFYDTLEAAKKCAMSQALNYSDVRIEKRAVYTGGESTVMRFERVVKKYKHRPTRVPEGAKLTERHAYIVYGWAAC